jgi:DNA-binding XRE family transcriptional regulator
MTTPALKARRVEAGVTRKQLADASGISQYLIDKIERGDEVGDDSRKSYATGMTKLAADQGKSSTKPTKKATAAKKTTTARKPRTRRSTTQPKAGAAAEAKAEAAA